MLADAARRDGGMLGLMLLLVDGLVVLLLLDCLVVAFARVIRQLSCN